MVTSLSLNSKPDVELVNAFPALAAPRDPDANGLGRSASEVKGDPVASVFCPNGETLSLATGGAWLTPEPKAVAPPDANAENPPVLGAVGLLICNAEANEDGDEDTNPANPPAFEPEDVAAGPLAKPV